MHRLIERVRMTAAGIIAAVVCTGTLAGCAMHLEGMSGKAMIDDARQEDGWFFMEELRVRIDVYPQWTRLYTKMFGIKVEDKTLEPDRLVVKFTVDPRVNELEVEFSKFELTTPCRDSIPPKTVELEGDLQAHNRGERPTIGRDIRVFRRIMNDTREPFWFRLEYVLPSCYDLADSLRMDLAGFAANGITVGPYVVLIGKSPHYEVRED